MLLFYLFSTNSLRSLVRNITTTEYFFGVFLPILFVIVFPFTASWAWSLYKKLKIISKRLAEVDSKVTSYTYLDPVTELYNYRYFMKHLKESVKISLKGALPFSIMKIDIELFNNINTIYGVVVGDSILREFAQFLKKEVRITDMIARLNNDEFGVIFDYTSPKCAVRIAQRIQQMLSLYPFGSHKKVALRVTIGLVSYPEDSVSVITLLYLVDRCLAKSKEMGGKIITPQELKLFSYRDNEHNVPQNSDQLKTKVTQLSTMLDKTIVESIVAFANTLKAKDLYTAEHTDKTVEIAIRIGEKLKLSSRQLDILRYAACLHDLGKIGIPEAILHKPGKLTQEEFEQIKQHPLIGAEILRPVHGLLDIIPVILYHHERIDGKGYPCGLRGEEIPLEAKIMAVADCYQALTSDRPYRKAFPIKKAISIIEDETGSHFDPQVIRIFKKVISEIDSFDESQVSYFPKKEVSHSSITRILQSRFHQ